MQEGWEHLDERNKNVEIPSLLFAVCAAGFYKQNQSCVLCPPETYKPFIGNSDSCLACPERLSTKGTTGNTHCGFGEPKITSVYVRHPKINRLFVVVFLFIDSSIFCPTGQENSCRPSLPSSVDFEFFDIKKNTLKTNFNNPKITTKMLLLSFLFALFHYLL